MSLRATAALVTIALGLYAAQGLPGYAAVGSDGLDPLFPGAGNGGYDVRHYDLRLRADPESGQISGRTTVTALATEDLTRFNLDLSGLEVSAVQVNGAATPFSRHSAELQVMPTSPIAYGAEFRVEVSYAGVPKPIVAPFPQGWVATQDGAWVANEPIGASTWFPGNDHPSDKASFLISITVPDSYKAISNGRLVSRATSNGWATWRWRQAQPMATYLATAAIGKFRLDRGYVHGSPYLAAYDVRSFKKSEHPISARQIGRIRQRAMKVLKFLSNRFGSYPFHDTGWIVDDPESSRIYYSLETQTRPISPGAPSKQLVVHELAHQWFGDSVTPETWRDLWLNEGVATWVQWYWKSRQSAKRATPIAISAERDGRKFMSSRSSWRTPPARPTYSQLFSRQSTYVRGALAIEAYRERLGTRKTVSMLRSWALRNRYGNVTTADFIAHAREAAGGGLGKFFDAWLLDHGRPPSRFR